MEILLFVMALIVAACITTLVFIVTMVAGVWFIDAIRERMDMRG